MLILQFCPPATSQARRRVSLPISRTPHFTNHPVICYNNYGSNHCVIEAITPGDLVYSTDPETGESEYKEVVRAFRKESDVIIHIFVNGEEIETTPNHPFWVEDQWVHAKDLREGDILTLTDGTTAVITKTYGEQLDEPVIVYNFEVQDFHTYYVTDTGVLVHNADYRAESNVYRGMMEDGGKPKVGDSARTLGVRPDVDIPVDANGIVYPNTGGMSVSPSPNELPTHRKPPEFGGTGKDPIWTINTNDLGSGLTYVPDNPGHGTIQPTKPMSLEDYKKALANTNINWEKVEWH